jgi:acetylornithine deacetylase/succinyl-diaminopimelate desuccinylase-like protein
MDVVALTRALVDIESITDNEERCGLYLLELLERLTSAYNGTLERMDVAPGRFNVLATFGLTRGRHICVGARRVRHEGHHRIDDQGFRGAAQ